MLLKTQSGACMITAYALLQRIYCVYTLAHYYAHMYTPCCRILLWSYLCAYMYVCTYVFILYVWMYVYALYVLLNASTAVRCHCLLFAHRWLHETLSWPSCYTRSHWWTDLVCVHCWLVHMHPVHSYMCVQGMRILKCYIKLVYCVNFWLAHPNCMHMSCLKCFSVCRQFCAKHLTLPTLQVRQGRVVHWTWGMYVCTYITISPTSYPLTHVHTHVHTPYLVPYCMYCIYRDCSTTSGCVRWRRWCTNSASAMLHQLEEEVVHHTPTVLVTLQAVRGGLQGCLVRQPGCILLSRECRMSVRSDRILCCI